MDVPESQVEQAIGQLDQVRTEWLRRPGVTGVDVGFKIRGDELTQELAVRVHVERKLPPEALAAHEVFSTEGQTERLGEFPIDVIEAAYGPSQAPAVMELDQLEDINRTSKVDPLIGGVSVGNPRITAGTLGAIVWDRTDCSVSLLSNWHVLVGDPAAVAGEAIWQPGKYDGGTAADSVATLTRFRLDADMDAALAKLNGTRGYTRDLVGLDFQIGGVENPVLGMNVIKSGRTTGVTKGVIDGVSFSGTISYDHGPNTFHGQIHIVPRPPWPSVNYELSKGGDSGSVWINEATKKAVGLHYGGETDPAPASEMSLANPMHKVAAATGLNFSFTPLFFCGIIPPFFRKPPLDDVVIKPPWKDIPKPLISDLPPKSLIDPIKLPGLDARLPFQPGTPVTRGGPAPFVFATPHHAQGMEPGESEYEAALEQLDAVIEHYGALRDQVAGRLGHHGAAGSGGT
ncbi:MAG TPA: hypothetical protein VHL78_06260 [Actinomycetota bacterium]|nr:hypothetical protein [Actinomycetota bacterium]